MKRTSLRRHTPLQATGPIRRKTRIRQRSRKRRDDSPETKARKAWLRQLPCCAPGAPNGCEGPMDPHHAGKKQGMRLKAPNDTMIPMCRRHHLDVDALWGPFRGWTGEQLRAWQDERVEEYRAAWEARQGGLAAMAF